MTLRFSHDLRDVDMPGTMVSGSARI